MGKNKAKKKREFTSTLSIQHGAYSSRIRRRYTDGRTREGKQLQAVMDSLVDDLGGQENLTAAQRVLLSTIESKLIVVLQIGKFIDKQDEIIKNGELLPVLGKNYLAYLNSLRLALDQLYKGHSAKSKVPTIEEYLAMKGESDA